MNRLNGYLDSFVDQAGYRQHGGIWSGISRGDTVIGSSGFIAFSGYQNVLISSFGGSGKIEYRGGPNEGWYASGPWGKGTGGPLNDGMYPIALSGLYGINDAYKANAIAFLNATFGDLNIIGNTRKTVFVPGSRAPLRVSGVLFAPINVGNTNNEQGDLMSCLHGVIKPVPKFTGSTMNTYSDPATPEEMTARAMGVGTLFFNTGSGIANISIGSGIGQWNFTTFNSTDVYGMPIVKEVFVRLPISTETIGDLNYSYASGPTGIAIFSPGLYKCTYSCSFRRLTPDASFRTTAVRAVLKQQGINALVPGISATDIIPQSISYAACQNANVPCASTSHSFLFNADAGDLIALEGALIDTSAGAGGGVNLTTSGTLIILEKVGPKRGRFS
jgi:hypothetical protein